MSEGPYLAPSSPPDTPDPIKRKPFSSRVLVLRIESTYSELPPSIIMSPGSIRGTCYESMFELSKNKIEHGPFHGQASSTQSIESCSKQGVWKYCFQTHDLTNFSMKSSTADPAFTSIIMRRGFFSFDIISSMEWAPTIFVPFASFSKNLSTFATVRL